MITKSKLATFMFFILLLFFCFIGRKIVVIKSQNYFSLQSKLKDFLVNAKPFNSLKKFKLSLFFKFKFFALIEQLENNTF